MWKAFWNILANLGNLLVMDCSEKKRIEQMNAPDASDAGAESELGHDADLLFLAQ